jgi:hypothetical protein
MRVKVQLVICADDEETDTIHEVAVLEKDCRRIEQLGLTLAEAKQLLTRLQQHVVAQRTSVFVTTRSHGEACGAPCTGRKRRPASYTPSLGPCAFPVLGSITVGVRCTRSPPSGR